MGPPAANVVVQGQSQARKMIGVVRALKQHQIAFANIISEPSGRVARYSKNKQFFTAYSTEPTRRRRRAWADEQYLIGGGHRGGYRIAIEVASAAAV